MRRVTGIGGVFFKARDPISLRRWYRERLGIGSGGENWSVFRWCGAETGRHGETVSSLFPVETYFGGASRRCMVNYRAENLDAPLERLRVEGVTVLPDRHPDENGRFAWSVDPEGNRIELWQPAEGR